LVEFNLMPRIDTLLLKLLNENGSDLHLSAGSQPMARIHGDMQPLSDEAVSADSASAIIREIMPAHIAASFDQAHDVDFGYAIPDVARFRVNAFLDQNGAGAVLRQVPSKIPTFDQLALPPVVRGLCALPRGIILVTGPTGSGKSTTLAAMIDEINRTREEHILTIEDPIEFIHPNKKCLVNQREVGPHTLSFARALKAALREDPDVILVGEMRDLETTAMAIETAATGHLVFSTLHTSSAVGTVDRIIDQFPAEAQAQVRAQLSSSLQAVLSQTLLKTKDGKGRVVALEVLISTPALSAQIREGKTHQINSTIQTGGRLGMCLLIDSLIRLVSRGAVSATDAYEATSDKEALLRAFQVANIRFENPALKGGPPVLAAEKAK
jgi:twitching motility protein PilT